MESKYQSGILKDKPANQQGLCEPEWILFRIDDNGNQIEMSRFRNHENAERIMKEYEAKGHKQAYFVRRHQT